MANSNAFIQSLRRGDTQVGIWCNLGHPETTEMCAAVGFDWLLIDGEHGPGDPQRVMAQLHALNGTATTPIVRPAAADTVRVKQLLDVGARNLLIPMVNTSLQAEEMAAAVEFPPTGSRGVATLTRGGRWGITPDYLASARDDICLIVQIESAEAVANAKEILAVDGIDAAFIGMSDLAASLGQPGSPNHPDVTAAVHHVREEARKASMPIGTLALDQTLAKRCLAAGFAFVAVGMDTQILIGSLRELSTQFRDQVRVRR